MKKLFARTGRRGGLAVGGAAVAIVTLATAALAASGTVNTAGAPLTVRSGPGTGYTAVGTVNDGASVTISCQTSGSTVTGTYGTSSLWDKIGTGRFVADSYVYTGSDNAVAPACSTSNTGMVDDYPYRGATSGIDPWNFYKGQCTSFAAWRIVDRKNANFSNSFKGQHWGNANHWDEAARAAGITVNNTPTVGSVAQSDAGSYGHVAWVAAVNSDGTVTVEEYNYASPDKYGTRRVSKGSFEYIHIG